MPTDFQMTALMSFLEAFQNRFFELSDYCKFYQLHYQLSASSRVIHRNVELNAVNHRRRNHIIVASTEKAVLR